MEKEVKKKKIIKEEIPLPDGLPLDIEKTEDIAEQIEDLIENDNYSSAIALFNQLRQGDQNEVIDYLPLEAKQKMLINLPNKKAAEILGELDIEDAVKVTEEMEPAILSDILDEADPDVQADILRQLPEEQSLDVLGEMKETEEVIPLLQYPDDSAGGRMVLEFVSIKEDMTAAGALEHLRLHELKPEDIRTIFVVDSENRLVGKLSVTVIALAEPATAVREIMNTDIIFVTSDTNQEECARVMERYSLDTLPIVDIDKHLIGVIMSENVLEIVEEEATEDMYRLAGITGERIFGPLYISMRNRIPWLTINLGTAFLAALVISMFESTIARVVTLAVFLPIIAGQGGIGGTQTLTLVVRSMALGEITRRGGLRLLGREILLGLIHGIMLGAIVGIVAYLWKGNYMLGIVLAIAMIGNMLIAGLSGAGVPLLLTRLRIDPAIASAVVVTTCTDVIGFFMFLGLATLTIGFLM